MTPGVAALEVGDLARACRALADETRLRMVALLAHGELCVCHLERALAVAQPTASRHLAVLRAAGLVEVRRQGSWSYYRLADAVDARVGAVVAALTSSLGAARTLKVDHARLRRSCGPGACA